MVRFFNHYIPSNIFFQVLLEALLILAALASGTVMQPPSAGWSVISLMFPTLPVGAALVILLAAFGLYRVEQPRDFFKASIRVLLAFGTTAGLLYLLTPNLPDREILARQIVMGGGLALAGVLALRALFSSQADKGLFCRRVLVLGTGPEAASVEQTLKAAGYPGLVVVGFYPLDSSEIAVSQHSVLPNTIPITETVAQLDVSEIVVAVRERRGGVLPLNQLLNCKLEGVRVIDLSTFFERIRGEVRIESLRASWLIYGEGFRQGALRGLVKRSFDIAASMILLCVTLPIMLLAALAIAIESPGPIIYRQERVGRGGRTFNVMKFRSMYSDAEADGKPRWAKANDSRITRVGKFARRTRIDELPQIFNVLNGDMSFVGPRPERPYFVAQLSQQIPFYAARHSVKPGITGWAQVKYKYGNTIDDAVHKLQYDLYYVKNHSLFLDILILFKTVSVVFSGEGAH